MDLGYTFVKEINSIVQKGHIVIISQNIIDIKELEFINNE